MIIKDIERKFILIEIAFSKYGKIRLFSILIIFLIIFFNTTSFVLAEALREAAFLQDYVVDKFDSAIFQLYLKSMEELDNQEIEFIDLLSEQSKDRQMLYGKLVYQEGFSSNIFFQLKKEVEDRDRQLFPEEEDFIPQMLPFPTQPTMKWWERLYAHVVSMRKVLTITEYNRFAMCGVDPARSERVVKRIKNYYDWNEKWFKEGQDVEYLAEKAAIEENIFLARRLFHEAAGCYHVGNFINFYDIKLKLESQEAARRCYVKAIALYEEKDRPIRIEIPFREAEIPGYLMLNNKPNQPLIIFVNVLNNIKEVENHYFALDFLEAGFNVFSFDGPGQGEMHQKMRLIPDYEQAIITIIDWFENNNTFNIDMERIGVVGLSFGGLSSVIAAAQDPRIDCVISNGGYAYIPPLSFIKKLHISTRLAVSYMSGINSMKEFYQKFGHLDIKNFPPLERPMLIIQGGKDDVVPAEHAFYFMDWAVGKDKELLYIEDSNHCCQDRFDIVMPYTIDWFKKYLYE